MVSLCCVGTCGPNPPSSSTGTLTHLHAPPANPQTTKSTALVHDFVCCCLIYMIFPRRDLKPTNIGLSAEGHVKLFDLGLAVVQEVRERSQDQKYQVTFGVYYCCCILPIQYFVLYIPHWPTCGCNFVHVTCTTHIYVSCNLAWVLGVEQRTYI